MLIKMRSLSKIQTNLSIQHPSEIDINQIEAKIQQKLKKTNRRTRRIRIKQKTGAWEVIEKYLERNVIRAGAMRDEGRLCDDAGADEWGKGRGTEAVEVGADEGGADP